MARLSSHSALVLCIFALHLVAANGRLRIVEAGAFSKTNRKPDIALPPGQVVDFCENSYSDYGFSIDCSGPNLRPPVSFFVNGKPVKIEKKWPYAIAGDVRSFRYRWSPPRASVSSLVTVSCASLSARPPVFYTAVLNFTCPAVAIRKETGCVIIKAENHLNSLPAGWTPAVRGGLTYRSRNMFADVDTPGTSTLLYTFSVPRKSVYAVTLDMTTRGLSVNNDVYMQFMYRGGLVLRNSAETKAGGDGFLRVYRQMTGRATEAFSGDNGMYSISTKAILSPGVTYYLAIGGRSSQVTLHRVVLFPCSKAQCSAYSDHWMDMVRKCK